MGRPKDMIRVSIKGTSGKTTRLNLVKMLDGRVVVYRDGKRREVMSASEFGKKMASWLRSQ